MLDILVRPVLHYPCQRENRPEEPPKMTAATAKIANELMTVMITLENADDKHHTATQIAKASGIGINRVRAALKELAADDVIRAAHHRSRYQPGWYYRMTECRWIKACSPA
jgi:DNA-binding GntR family transcriptional regulator